MAVSSLFISFDFFNTCIPNHTIQYCHPSPLVEASLCFLIALVLSGEKRDAEPRFEHGPALQQATSALSTELRCKVRNSYLVEDGTVVLDEGSDGGQALGVLLLQVGGLLLIGGYTVTKACRTFRFLSIIQRQLHRYKRRRTAAKKIRIWKKARLKNKKIA